MYNSDSTQICTCVTLGSRGEWMSAQSGSQASGVYVQCRNGETAGECQHCSTYILFCILLCTTFKYLISGITELGYDFELSFVSQSSPGAMIHPSPKVAEYIRSLPRKSPRKSPLAKYFRLKNRSPFKSAVLRSGPRRIKLNFFGMLRFTVCSVAHVHSSGFDVLVLYLI